MIICISKNKLIYNKFWQLSLLCAKHPRSHQESMSLQDYDGTTFWKASFDCSITPHHNFGGLGVNGFQENFDPICLESKSVHDVSSDHV